MPIASALAVVVRHPGKGQRDSNRQEKLDSWTGICFKWPRSHKDGMPPSSAFFIGNVVYCYPETPRYREGGGASLA